MGLDVMHFHCMLCILGAFVGLQKPEDYTIPLFSLRIKVYDKVLRGEHAPGFTYTVLCLSYQLRPFSPNLNEGMAWQLVYPCEASCLLKVRLEQACTPISQGYQPQSLLCINHLCLPVVPIVLVMRPRPACKLQRLCQSVRCLSGKHPSSFVQVRSNTSTPGHG